MNVLLVDDAPELVMLFRLILEREQGFSVTPWAKDFDTICDKVDWTSIDVAVLDQWLDGFDGKVILEWIEENHPSIRRILLTADSEVGKTEAHAEVVLRKPIDHTDFIKAIRGTA